MRIVAERRKDVNVGDRSGMLVVIGPRFRYRLESGPCHARVCECDCGNVAVILEANIRAGAISCGCQRGCGLRTHGKSKSPLASVWDGMKTRCGNPNEKSWKRYGGRGISVCEEWANSFESFHNWAIVSGWRKGLEIDRINNDGNYEPGNCRFITKQKNCRNRRDNRPLEAFGETKMLCEWPEDARCKTNYKSLFARLKLGWNAEDAISTPTRVMQRTAS